MDAPLTTEQKTFVVQQLAMFQTPTEVTEAVKEQFGFDMSRQLAAYYNAEQNPSLPKVWCDVFHATRVKFLEQISDIPLSHQSYRLKQLQNSLNRQLKQPRKNEAMIHSILEQASKEIGGMFTNQRQITGANGKPLFDPVEMAKIAFEDLIKDGIDKPIAIQAVIERYKVSEEILVSEANN